MKKSVRQYTFGIATPRLLVPSAQARDIPVAGTHPNVSLAWRTFKVKESQITGKWNDSTCPVDKNPPQVYDTGRQATRVHVVAICGCRVFTGVKPD